MSIEKQKLKEQQESELKAVFDTFTAKETELKNEHIFKNRTDGTALHSPYGGRKSFFWKTN